MSERKFKLLKDLPFVKAGSIYKKFNEDGYYIPVNRCSIYNNFNVLPTKELAVKCAALCLETRKKFFKERVKGYKNEVY